MAAIDKIYLDSKDNYLQFKEWCKQQPLLRDKYNKEISLTAYMYNQDDYSFKQAAPVFMAPYYVDAYVIKNCPFEFIQKEMMINYGHWSQEKINEAYDIVMHREEQNMLYYQWLSEKDFKVVDGIITMPNLEESSYSKIKRGVLFNSPSRENEYIAGKHFNCIKHPVYKYNTPLKAKYWSVSINLPEELGFMWYHKDYDSWDFSDEFVIGDRCTTAFFKTIKSIKRHILKWKLPVGTTINITGRYTFDTYTFVVKK